MKKRLVERVGFEIGVWDGRGVDGGVLRGLFGWCFRV